MKLNEIAPGILGTDQEIVHFDGSLIDCLKGELTKSDRGRVRFCAHKSNDDRIHEMIIVMARGTYVCPHRHLTKGESFHIIEGAVDIIVFKDDGEIDEVIELGDRASGKDFFYRMDTPRYHTVIVQSDVLVVHETTNGPFNAELSDFAPWAPREGDKNVESYAQELRQKLENRS